MIEPNTVFICEPHLKLITGAHNVFHTDGSIHSPAAQTQVLKWSFASHAYSMLGRFILVRRVCLIVGLLYGYRALTMIITVLPAANPEYLCDPQVLLKKSFISKHWLWMQFQLNHTISAGEVAHRVVKIISGFGLSINGQVNVLLYGKVCDYWLCTMQGSLILQNKGRTLLIKTPSFM